MNKNPEQLKGRHQYIIDRLEDVPKHRRHPEIKKLADELFISETTIYRELGEY